MPEDKPQPNRLKTKLYYEALSKMNERLAKEKEKLEDLPEHLNDEANEQYMLMRVAEEHHLYKFSKN